MLQLEDTELTGYPNASERLNRVRRYMSFVQIWNDTDCYRQDAVKASSREMCEFVKNKWSCSFYVETINLLEMFFCTFHLTWDTSIVFILSFIYLGLCYLIYMITKYFCLPNYITMMELLPISEYAYSYVFFGFHLMQPDYMEFLKSCSLSQNIEDTLKFSTVMGDILRFFVTGVMMLCIRGYHVDGLLWWSNMSIILLGFVYICFVVDLKYRAFGAPDLLYSDASELTFNAMTFLSLFLLINGLALLLSYHNLIRQPGPSPAETESGDEEEEPEVSSETDVEKQKPLHSEHSACRIWWNTVNGNANIKERYSVMKYLFIPFYFLMANITPVMDRERPMNGWCKIVIIFGFLVYPICLIEPRADPTSFLVVWAFCWFFVMVVIIAFHPLQQPGDLLTFIYSVLGSTIGNIILFHIADEIGNLTWQYMVMRFENIRETVVILFFHGGEMVWYTVLLYNLIERDRQDAAFGTVMGIVTHMIYMALPLLSLCECYTSESYIVFTAKMENCYIFFLVIFFGTFFHVSMSSNEFRLSLFFYLVAMTTTFFLFEVAVYYEWVHPFGALTLIKPPRDTVLYWA